jgi:hypothetical protein
MKIKIFIILAFFAIMSGSTLFGQQNIISNPSFEDAVNGKPTAWQESGWKRDPDISALSLDTSVAHSGKNSVKIVNMKENHAYYTQVVAVEEKSIYKLSAWIKTENVGTQSVGAAIGIKDKLDVGGDVRDTSGSFKPAEMYVRTGSGITSFTVLVSVGWYGSLNTGTAWFDDVSLVKTDSIPGGAVTANLEPAAQKVEKQQEAPASQEQKSPGAMIFFFILGGIVVLAGLLYFILVVAKKKDKGATGGDTTGGAATTEETKPEEDASKE